MQVTQSTANDLADREAIRQVALRYSHGVDRLDGDWMKSAYWPEAIDHHGAFVGNAWDFVDYCMQSHLKWRATLHCIFNHQIDLAADGVTARGEIYNVIYLFGADNSAHEVWAGRYLDAYEKRGDEWRIIERVWVHEGTSAPPLLTETVVDWRTFRPGSFDRPSSGRPIGP